MSTKDVLTIKILRDQNGYIATFKPLTTVAYGHSWSEILMEIYGLLICHYDSLKEDKDKLAENLKKDFEFLDAFLKKGENREQI